MFYRGHYSTEQCVKSLYVGAITLGSHALKYRPRAEWSMILIKSWLKKFDYQC